MTAANPTTTPRAARVAPATPAASPLTQADAAAIVTANAPLAHMVLQISVPRESVRWTLAELDKNPKGGPRYAQRHQHGDLNYMYAIGEVHLGIQGVLYELASAPDTDPKLIEVFRNAEAAARADGRLDRFDQEHNIVSGWPRHP